ncbi:hypothetical protein D9O50_17985 [Oxalobacteraceae bacterium CAVE-383]|nr:hypothetical protein D9O50_17985 [Oxalobacteraceae bacterium CAVE-383]
MSQMWGQIEFVPINQIRFDGFACVWRRKFELIGWIDINGYQVGLVALVNMPIARGWRRVMRFIEAWLKFVGWKSVILYPLRCIRTLASAAVSWFVNLRRQLFFCG